MKLRYGVYILVFIGFAIAVFFQYDHKFRSQTTAIEFSLRQGATRINDLLTSSANAVDTLQFLAESRFHDPRAGRLPAPLRQRLSARPGWDGFALPSLPAGMTPDTVGNLTGSGSPTDRSAEWEREIDVALSLNPLFQATLKEIPNAVWVYYTSARKFINICPWVSDTEFHYTPDLLEHAFYADGLPKRNPERKRFWTAAYIDLYGKGMMVTLAAPVDDDKGAFRGTVALDLTLDDLSDFSRAVLSPGQPGTTVLVNASGQILAHPSLVASSDKLVKMADAVLPQSLKDVGRLSAADEKPRLQAAGDDLISWKRLDQAPWTLAYFVKASMIRNQVLGRMIPEAAVFVFLLLSLYLVERQFRISDALRESERKFRHLIEFAPIGIFLSIDYKYIYTNPAGAKIVGLSDPGEIVGKSVTAFHHPEDKPKADRRVGQLLSDETTEVPRLEFKIVKTDGSERDLDAVSTTIDWGGERAVLAMVNDITDRKTAERALAESEERFAKAFHASPVAMAISKIDDGRLMEPNRTWLSLWGYSREEVVGKTARELAHWVDVDQRTIFIERLKREGTVRDFEAKFQTKAGEKRTVLLGGETIDIKGEPCLLLVFHDITERQSLERQLRHAQKMEVVGQLAGGTAHDFNNLLQVVQANLDLIAFKLGGNDKVRQLVESAKSAVRRGARLSQQLLSFSRRQTLRPETIDPTDLIERTAGLLRRTLGEDIEIDIRLEQTAGSIIVDPNGLENAILNLALNARAAMPGGGKLTIRSTVRRLDDEMTTEEGVLPAGDYMEISVIDIGCGMPPDVLAHAFEPFFSTKAEGGGSGLGLSMVYGFTLQSGGHAELESAVGTGTTVRMLFPMAAAKPGIAPEEQEEPVATPAVGTILVVEDDPRVRTSVVMLLDALGYSTLEAENGDDALTMLERNAGIDLLFTDVVMPKGMGGVELADKAVRRHPTLKVLLTSGYAEEVAGAANRYRLLGKPYTNEELTEVIVSLLSS